MRKILFLREIATKMNHGEIRWRAFSNFSPMFMTHQRHKEQKSDNPGFLFLFLFLLSVLLMWLSLSIFQSQLLYLRDHVLFLARKTISNSSVVNPSYTYVTAWFEPWDDFTSPSLPQRTRLISWNHFLQDDITSSNPGQNQFARRFYDP